MSGADYLSLSSIEKTRFVKASLERFEHIRRWNRSDFLCEGVMSEEELSSLYEKAAEEAQEHLLAHVFSVLSNERCIEHGQVLK